MEAKHEIGPEGLLFLNESERRIGRMRGRRNFLLLFLFPLLLGVPVAFLIYSLGDTAAYEQNLAAIARYSGPWVFITAFVFSRLSAFMNLFPMVEKEQLMPPDSGSLRANMKIFTVLNSEPPGTVVMDMDGQTGRYNRASRSLENFVENAAPIGINAVLLSLCFPFPAVILVCIFAAARILYQVQYIKAGYASVAKGIGYASGLAAAAILEGLLLAAAINVW